MKREKNKKQELESRNSYQTTLGKMLRCIRFLIRNTREKKIEWSLDGFAGNLNGAIKFKGLLPNGGWVIIEQSIAYTHFWNSIHIYNASGELESRYMPNWQYGKSFWLLIGMARQNVLYRQFQKNLEKKSAKRKSRQNTGKENSSH